ncbi:YcxB family protein [Actinoplanes sp. CA-015351]|uniref:YcxB family protein n=1 Tax=Actinoplanes sp. CA-015351 TaxID=3239897 RepID=UPI003D99E79E
MQIQITAAPDPVLIAAAVRRGLRRSVLLARSAGWAGLLAAAFVLVTTGSLSPALLAIGAVLAVGVPLIMLNRTARRTMRGGRPTTYEISEGGIACADEQSRHSYAWPAIRSVDELPGQPVFGLVDGRFLPVPTMSVTTAQVDQILAVAATHGLAVSSSTRSFSSSARSFSSSARSFSSSARSGSSLPIG